MTNRGTIGELVPSAYDRFYWKIGDLRSLSATVGDFYCSPEMQYSGFAWKLSIYPNGSHSIQKWTVLQVFRTCVSDAESVGFSLGIKKNDSSEEVFISSERLDSTVRLRQHKIIRQEILLEKWTELTFMGALNIVVHVWTNERTSTEGKDLHPSRLKRRKVTDVREEDCAPKGDDPAFRQHLENMLLSGSDHDVTIQVKDQQFRAHKNMLRTRSPVFSAMFEHQMKESAEDSISIEDCDPESFGEFLRYVYTGRVENLSMSNAMGLYYAGDKYEFLDLKRLCVEYLKTSLCTAGITDVISLAVRHNEEELLERVIAYFSRNLVEIMSSVEWQRFNTDNPVRANEICLKAVKCHLGKN